MKQLAEISKVFLKLGAISFGGPAAHIAMMENEVVKKRNWITHDHFIDLIGATNLIPGPNSTEMTMHCGYERAGWKGLFVAGLSFILPAITITAVFAWLYQKYGQLPEVSPFIYGIKPAVIAIILGATYSLTKKAIKSIEIIFIGIASLIAFLVGINEILTLFLAGTSGVIFFQFIKRTKEGNTKSFIPFLLIPAGNLKIFLIFLKVGAVLYGSGYVLFGLLEGELVTKGIISHQQLMDAVAVGQFTPGPVLSSATFIGWQLNGFSGSLIATIGIFLPSFLFVLVLNPLIPKMRSSKIFSAFLNAVNIASVALILAVGIEMSRATLNDWRMVLIAVTSLAVTFVFKKVNNAFIVAGGAIMGYLLWLL